MEKRFLSNGIEVEIDVQPTKDGYMVIHRLAKDRQYYTVTCCCGEGSEKKCVSKTCSYPEGTPPSPTCDCTGSTPVITC